MTQYELIKKTFLEQGFISRNWCLDRRITRLSAYALDLKKEGYNFKGMNEGGDYVYRRLKVSNINIINPLEAPLSDFKPKQVISPKQDGLGFNLPSIRE